MRAGGESQDDSKCRHDGSSSCGDDISVFINGEAKTSVSGSAGDYVPNTVLLVVKSIAGLIGVAALLCTFLIGWGVDEQRNSYGAANNNCNKTSCKRSKPSGYFWSRVLDRLFRLRIAQRRFSGKF